MKARILQRTGKVFVKFLIGLERDERRVGVHAVKNVFRERPEAGSIFHDHSRVVPVDLLQHFIHHKPRARQKPTDLVRVPEKIQREEQQLRSPAAARSVASISIPIGSVPVSVSVSVSCMTSIGSVARERTRLLVLVHNSTRLQRPPRSRRVGSTAMPQTATTSERMHVLFA